ncbi:ATP-binding cassette domain-containing protein [Flavobacterium cupreum]|uniref:ATP-binding cassette domain-containing protein n=1 Tax=Flavobacterium cupreum TaxID=2133766 RepID=UPI001EDF65BB|nr:ATP-binding cassette domain-containing protein [Flavobacterium cupreum]
MSQVHCKEDEDDSSLHKVSELSENKTIEIKDLSYRYGGKSTPFVLKDLNCSIPEGKTKPTMGASGSGKTTLMTLLLKYYEPTKCSISIGGIELNHINNDFWRSNCGAVMQDTFMFDDTIASNIS